MPDAKDNAKLTGDTHPPEVEDAGRSPPGKARPDASPGNDAAQAQEDETRPGKGINQAGFLKDDDAGAGKDKP